VFCWIANEFLPGCRGSCWAGWLRRVVPGLVDYSVDYDRLVHRAKASGRGPDGNHNDKKEEKGREFDRSPRPRGTIDSGWLVGRRDVTERASGLEKETTKKGVKGTFTDIQVTVRYGNFFAITHPKIPGRVIRRGGLPRQSKRYLKRPRGPGNYTQCLLVYGSISPESLPNCLSLPHCWLTHYSR
jgi:hypothetical protein